MLEEENKASHAFISFNIGAMQPKKDYDKSMGDYIDNIKNFPKAKGKDKIIHGEIEWEKV